MIDLTVFLAWNYLTLTNMLQASFYGGGYVPLRWYPTREEEERRLQYCPRCEGFKAPRSHHCRKCDRCVMRMDHHCPWINNCVGHRNQTFFMRFLLFAVVGSLHACVLLTVPIYETLALVSGVARGGGEWLYLINSPKWNFRSTASVNLHPLPQPEICW